MSRRVAEHAEKRREEKRKKARRVAEREEKRREEKEKRYAESQRTQRGQCFWSALISRSEENKVRKTQMLSARRHQKNLYHHP